MPSMSASRSPPVEFLSAVWRRSPHVRLSLWRALLDQSLGNHRDCLLLHPVHARVLIPSDPIPGAPMGYKVVEVQPTPNPNAAKFMLDRAVVEQPTSFFNAAAATGHPL